MMEKKKYFLALIMFVTVFNLFAEHNQEEEIHRQISEIMKARDEMLKSLFNDSGFQNFDKQFEDLVKKFEKENFGQAFNMDIGVDLGEYDWRETQTQQIFVLKVKQIKDKPLDIKIEKGQIKFKGDIESVSTDNFKNKKRSRVHFERTFSIPDGVDQINPEFDNKNGELLIKFKKLKGMKSTPKKKGNNLIEDTRPVDKEVNDLTI